MDKSQKDAQKYYDRFYSNKKIWVSPWNEKIIAYLRSVNNKKISSVLEIGCGKGDLLYFLKKEGFEQSNLYGFDLSVTGVKQAQKLLPKSHIQSASLFTYTQKHKFDYIILAEVIEHLDDFNKGVDKIVSMLKDTGQIIITFPNFYNIPWLMIRLASEFFDKPNWIILQPVDHIYTYTYIVKELGKRGFKLHYQTGTVYLPPYLYQLENNFFHKIMDKLGLTFLAFHPLLCFKK